MAWQANEVITACSNSNEDKATASSFFELYEIALELGAKIYLEMLVFIINTTCPIIISKAK